MSRRLRLSICLLLLIVSLCPGARGQSEATRPKETDEPANGVITGKVVNEHGQPVAGASLFIRSANSVVTGRSTGSDSDGNFRFGGLEPALYNIVAIAPTYASVLTDSEAQSTYYRIGDTVRLEMVRGGVVTGTITNAAGEPVIAVRVRATMIRDDKGRAPRISSFSFNEQVTDDRGVYRIWGLAPGTYLVSAGGSSFSQAFQFNPYDSDSPTYAPSSTRDTAAEVSVRGGEDTNADIRYRGEPGYIVSGTVKAATDHDPAVNLIPAGEGMMPTGVAMQFPGSRGFSFYGVGDGDYDLVAQAITSGLGSNAPLFALSDSKRITVRGGNVTGIELVTKSLPSLNGRIMLEPSKIPSCQGKRPPLFAETVVHLQRPDKEEAKQPSGTLRLFGMLAGSTSPNREWAFGFRNLLPGRYQFEPTFYARYWYLRSITLGSAATTAAKSQPVKTDAAANWTLVKSGDQLTTLTITIAEGAASIQGKLTVPEGAAVPASSFVYLVPSEPDKSEDVLHFFVAEIAADGTFALNNLPPGKYWSLAQVTNDVQISTVRKLRQPESVTARTKLRRSAETHKSEIELKPCQNVADYQIRLK